MLDLSNAPLKTVNLQPENSKKNKQTNKILKIWHGILLYSKNFFPFFSKIWGGRWRTSKQLFLGLIQGHVEDK